MYKWLLICFPFLLFAHNSEQLLCDLKLVDEIEAESKKELPILYNNTMMGGYISMPSARMAKAGTAAIGAAYAPPYILYSLNFQPFNEIELSGNYRVFRNQKEANFGNLGFGDDADRTANAKFSFDWPKEYAWIPKIAIGFEDFFGSQRFYAGYLVVTSQLAKYGLEMSVGYGKGRIKRGFGGIAWTPYFMPLTLMAEYDATDYKHHPDEHEKGRSVKSRVNIGAAFHVLDVLQLKIASLRGEKVSGLVNFHYNFGETRGFFPKFKDPKLYTAPKDLQPLGVLRTEKELAREFAFAFKDQGLTLTEVRLYYGEDNRQNLWMRVINLRYWRNSDLKERILYLLSHLMPENIGQTTVVIEERGIDVESFRFTTSDLYRFREAKVSDYELKILTPMQEVYRPTKYDSTRLYYQCKNPWNFAIAPEFITFFGSTRGKLKGSVGMQAALNGYLCDAVFYQISATYHMLSSMSDVGDRDVYNPSQLLNVRSDLVKYYKTQTVSLDQAYLQKGWNFGSGLFFRLSGGYFEIAYGGLSSELLYYPVGSPFAVGVEAAGLLKRDYRGLGFTTKVRKLNGFTPTYVDFIGFQSFLNLYYDIRPLQVDLHIKAGYFLARDVGARFEATRYYPSGLRFSLWYTLTTAKDIVNGKRYNDKGIAFSIPFDVFLTKSSRLRVGYGMSAWLRDTGASSFAGDNLYYTIQSSRVY